MLSGVRILQYKLIARHFASSAAEYAFLVSGGGVISEEYASDIIDGLMMVIFSRESAMLLSNGAYAGFSIEDAIYTFDDDASHFCGYL